MNDLERMGQRGERIAQFMGQHGQKLILSLAGLLQALGLAEKLHLHSFSLGNIGNKT